MPESIRSDFTGVKKAGVKVSGGDGTRWLGKECVGNAYLPAGAAITKHMPFLLVHTDRGRFLVFLSFLMRLLILRIRVLPS